MTTEFLNANVQIVKVDNLVFVDANNNARFFSRGFAFFVAGFGYLGFATDGFPYVLPRKKMLQSILNEGGFCSMNNVAFYDGQTIREFSFSK